MERGSFARILSSVSLITANSQKRDNTTEVSYRSVRIFETRLLLDFKLQSLECALIRNGKLGMRANEKPPTENTRSPSALLRYVLLISVLTAANPFDDAHSNRYLV